jgi:hypothetical protein
MGFFSSLFGGSNPTLNAGVNQAGQTSTFANTKGQGLTSQAGDFYSSLLSGDPKAQAKLLAPQIGTMQKQGQQAKQTASQFGNRSGGTNAAMQSIDDKTRANVSSMISDLTSKGAAGAASMGQNLIDTGLTALGQQTQMSQQQMENWASSLFGQGIAGGLGALEGLGLSKIPGMGAAVKMFSPAK